MCRFKDRLDQIRFILRELQIDPYDESGKLRDIDNIVDEIADKLILRPDKFREIMRILPIE